MSEVGLGYMCEVGIEAPPTSDPEGFLTSDLALYGRKPSGSEVGGASIPSTGVSPLGLGTPSKPSRTSEVNW